MDFSGLVAAMPCPLNRDHLRQCRVMTSVVASCCVVEVDVYTLLHNASDIHTVCVAIAMNKCVCNQKTARSSYHSEGY